MKKILLSLIAVLAMDVNAFADTTIDAGVKMTYIDGSNTTTAAGAVDKAYCGYNKISGGAVALANSKWGVNYVAYVQVDASAIPEGATITNVTLTADLQQISARGLKYGCGYNSSEWSDQLTWETADRTITTCGSTVSTSKSSSDLTGKTFDITDAFKNDADNIATILVYQTAAGGGYITNVTATVSYSMTKQATYTVKFMDMDGNEVKTAETRSGDENGSISITDADQASFYNADKTIRYDYLYDDASSKTIAADGSTVVTVYYDLAQTHTLTAQDQFGNVISSTTVFDGENGSVYIPYYRFIEGTLYGTPTSEDGTISYGNFTVTAITDDVVATVNYTKDANNNCVYYSEAEDIEGANTQNDTYTNSRMSNGKAGYFSAQTSIITLPAGVYTVTASTRAGSTTFYANEETVLALSSGGSVTTTTGSEFTVYVPTDITVSAGSSKAYFDYVLIRKTGEADPEVIAAKDALKTSIDAANEFLSTMEDGDAKDQLAENIDVAQAVYNNSANAEELTAAKEALDAAVENAKIATSISDVNVATKTSNGKFIQNGAVVIVKNGQKFNVAGAQMK